MLCYDSGDAVVQCISMQEKLGLIQPVKFICPVWDLPEDGRSSDSPVGSNFASPHWYIDSFCLFGCAIVTLVGQIQSSKFYHPIIVKKVIILVSLFFTQLIGYFFPV